MSDGLDLFVNCLGFKVLYQDESLAVVARDNAKAYVVESPEFAAKDRPEIAIETDSIAAIYAEIAAKRPEMLHPNSPVVEKKPWGAHEFAVRDTTDVALFFVNGNEAGARPPSWQWTRRGNRNMGGGLRGQIL